MATCSWLLVRLVWAWPLLCMYTWFWEEPISSPGVLKRTLSHIWFRVYLIRNHHKYIQENYGLEALQLLWLWEKSDIRDCDYKNHRRFTLRCITNGIVLVSDGLMSACSKTSKRAKEIIQKAEKQLLQDRVKCINATIENNGNNIDSSMSWLPSIVTNTTDIDQCSKFIKKVREDQLCKIKDRQVNKFNILVSKSSNKSSSHNNQMQASIVGNNNNRNNRNSNNSELQVETDSKWVINLSKTSLTKGQITVLAKGPNFAIAPRHVPNIDYTTAIESVCPKLKEEDAGELRADINSLLRRTRVPKSSRKA